jgi:hypothetical protein
MTVSNLLRQRAFCPRAKRIPDAAKGPLTRCVLNSLGQQLAVVMQQQQRRAFLDTHHTSNMETIPDDSHHHDEVCADDTDSVRETAPVAAVDELRASKAAEKKEIEAMARKETNRLRMWRLILLLVMISTGTMVSIATFLYIRQQQEKETLQSVRLSIVLVE